MSCKKKKKSINKTCLVPQLRLADIASIAKGIFNEFKSDLHGISSEHVS